MNPKADIIDIIDWKPPWLIDVKLENVERLLGNIFSELEIDSSLSTAPLFKD